MPRNDDNKKEKVIMTTVKVKDVKLDPDNPNELTDEQMTGLRKSIERFGFLQPIIIDQNNLVCDGQHRFLVYKQMGLNEIPAYKIKFKNKTEQKMLRQAMNKIKGRHDIYLDAKELETILQNDSLPELAELIGQQQANLESIIDSNLGNVDVNDKANQNFNDAIEIDKDAENIKKRLGYENERECPKCGYRW